ncbi:MAG: ABC transporter ATP-binding protein [Saprospiraceae bacterium]|jgi:ABC-type multidrug transport system fused ATPase/permease subunit|nr:ABC transporter ATP-binding protein [Saprospiraceae bacterium]MBP9194851.1 ABC transporter ATP-binding protein [Saprospiraceae bacterium]
MKGLERLIAYLGRYKPALAASIVSNLLLSVFTVVSIPIIIPFFQLLFDRVPRQAEGKTGIEAWMNTQFISLIESQGKEKALLLVCAFIILIFFFKNLFRYLALYFIAPVRNGIVRDLRHDLFQHFLALPLSFYSEERKGDLMSRASLDVQEIEWSILNVIESIFKAPIIIAGCLIFMFYISASLSIFVFVLLIFTALIIGGVGRSLRSSSSQVQVKLGNLSSMIEETLSGLRIIRAYNAQEFTRNKFNVENESYYRTLNKLLRKRDMAAPMSEFLGVTVVAVLLWFGTSLVMKNEMSPETFFAFVFAFYQIIEPSKYFASAWYNVQKGRAAMDRIESILKTETQATISGGSKNIATFKDKIEFHNVVFTYNNADQPALNGVSFTVNKGEKVALVGPSGGGKSTLMDTLIRFQEITSGSITIDGTDIRELDINAIRSLFGVVTQEAILFNDTISNNIGFGIDRPSPTQVTDAAKTANAFEFIDQLPEKFNYNIGDKGGKLSGGQKQRLTIARAVYRNPPIMILDEATSSLDSESEKIVQDAIDHIMEDRTSFVIAHRLSTIKKADKIIVIVKGKILAMGKHEWLYENAELYRNLVDNQNMAI